MAVDKLVDSTQLNTDLTSVANAIRTKGGTSAQLAFPAGFVSAVQAIPTGTTPTGTKQISITQNGTTTEDVAAYANAEISVNVSGGDYWQYVKTLQNTFWDGLSVKSNSLPDRMELNVPSCAKVQQAFQRQATISGNPFELILHFNSASPVITSLRQALYYIESRVAVTITGDLSGVNDYYYLIQYTGSITAIYGELDFSSCTTANSVNIGGGGATSLTHLRYRPNTLSVSQNLSAQQVLDEDSLVSIANGLNESATDQTLTLYATRKALCDSIMGTVALDGTNTYHVFTRDAGGSVSLSDFITTTKGWTLA